MSEPTDTDSETEGVSDDWASAFDEQKEAESADGEKAADDQPADAQASADTATDSTTDVSAGDDAETPAGDDAQAEQPQQEYQRVEIQDLEDDGEKPLSEDENMDLILDIPVTISMEIGRTMINIRNLLQLNQGSVVELDRLAGEPMDVVVNGTLIAHGEVVVVNEKFGIRLTDVISPAERIKKLK